MWVERLEVSGFKRLSGTFSFDPELTIVVGPNEAGKSSLGEAFMRSVWGFDRSERRRRADGSRWERCRPWDSRPWRIVAALVDHEGRRLRAEWNFEDHKVRLLDAVTGEDLSSHVDGARGDVRLGIELTGVPFADFRDVCRFDQHTLSQVERSDSLVNALQRAVESAHSDVGVTDADGRLKDFLNLHVGARSDNYSLLGGGPLKRERDERAQLVDAIEAAQLEEAEIAKLAQELRRRELQRAVLVDERTDIERAIRVHELTEARGLASEALRQVELSDQLTDEAADLDVHAAEQAIAGFAVLEQIDAAIVELEQRALAAAPEVDAARARETELSAATSGGSDGSAIDRSRESEVRDGLAQIRRLAAEPTPTIPEVPAPDPLLARYRQTRTELLSLANEATMRWDVARLLLAGVVALASCVIAAVVTPIGLAGLAVAAILIATARVPARVTTLTGRLRDEFGVENVEDLERRAQEEDSLIATANAEADAARNAIKAHNDQLEGLMTKLAEDLDLVGAPTGPVEERAARYIRACDQHAAMQEHAAALSEIRRQLSELTTPDRELVARRVERERALAELRRVLDALGLDSAEPAEARLELDRRISATREATEQRAQVSGARDALGALLGERTLHDVEADVERAQERLDAHIARYPEAQPTPGELPQLRDRMAEVDQRLRDAERSASALHAQIDERESRLPGVPELRERLATLEASIAHRELLLDAVRVAREALAEAARQAHRNFAPHLQRALRRTLPLFTAGRYSDVTIGDDLTMSVVAPETGTAVPADCLSLATQDQIYLVQRLEIAKMLIPASGPVPLLLDEPFAEFDEDREMAAIGLICDEAENRQVVLFTKDPRLVDRVAAVRGTPHTIELQGPASPVVTA